MSTDTAAPAQPDIVEQARRLVELGEKAFGHHKIYAEYMQRPEADFVRCLLASGLSIAKAYVEAVEWRCISTYNPKTDPECVLVCYEDGFVVPAEYMEHCAGGPDDHQTWSPVWPSPTKTCVELERDWPTHWRLFPAPPTGGTDGR